MKTTFVNTSSDKEERRKLRQEGRSHLMSRAEDLRGYMEYGNSEDSSTDEDNDRKAFFESTGDFYEYGLSIDYVAPGTFKNKRGYLRYQFSWGGPSEEVRFYLSPGTRQGSFQADRIEFVFLNWGVGVGFDVTKEDWAQWLFDELDSMGIIQSEINKAHHNE